jgi:hypothetical protein
MEGLLRLRTNDVAIARFRIASGRSQVATTRPNEGTRCQVVTERGIQTEEQKRAGSAGVEERNGQRGTERGCTSTIHVELESPRGMAGMAA